MYDWEFDAENYVRKNCSSYISGFASSTDEKKIENDRNLTSAQKEMAKDKLRSLANIYY